MASTFGPSTSPISPAQLLMNKGKRAAAAYIHAECSNKAPRLVGTANQQHLNGLLDILLNPSIPIDNWETIDWCKWLMAGRRTPDEFSSTVRLYDNATTCGLVWTPSFIAYRCRTCSISPCMALCTDCFKRGDHYRHDFNMFLSQAGGACDCGDTSVMQESGFCDRHGPTSASNTSPAPSDLMCVAEAMMPRMILRLIQHFRDSSKMKNTNDYQLAVVDADLYLTMLLDLNHMGASMRHVMTSALTDPQKYKSLMNLDETTTTATTSSPSSSSSSSSSVSSPPIINNEHNNYRYTSHVTYRDAIKSLPSPEPPDEYKDCPSLQDDLTHSTFLEELIFWTVVYEFPQKLVCLLLNMLPDPDYKESLTRAFVLHYSRIAMMLEKTRDPDTLSNRVVHVSVQLFSNKALALRMVDELKLLHVMVICLKYMMSKILIENTLHTATKNFHSVVDCARQVMKEHCYWPLVSDLNNVLSHKPVALKFLSDDALLEMWFDFLSMFQGMNVNQREMGAHVEFEPTTYYAAFSAELEASAYPMWALVSHLHGPESSDVSKKALTFCLTALQDWLDAIGFTSPDICDIDHVSFHIPLHRYFSVLMCQAVKQQGTTLQELLPSNDMLHLLMMHPLRVQVALHEILNGLWVRNGLQIKGQAMTYIQCNFCNSMVDADIYLLQICATKLRPDIFINTIIDKFHVKEWLNSRATRSNRNLLLTGEHDVAMMESCLTFLATLMNVRTNLGLTDTEVSHLEMVTLLCMGDRTHSQLTDLMPERSGATVNRDFENVLSEVAQFRIPNFEPMGAMYQGMYGPKPKVWEKLYDPLHVLLRAVHRKDYQISMDRFTEYAKQSSKFKTLWPPFRYPSPVSSDYDDPRIVLRTKVFHSMIFSVLYNAVNDNIPENIVALAVYLMEMAVVTADDNKINVDDKMNNPLCPYTGSDNSSDDIACGLKDSDFTKWYQNDRIIENLKAIIPKTRSNLSSEVAADWEIESNVTENSLMLNDEFDVEISEQGVWDLELQENNDDINRTAPMETTQLPPLLPLNDSTNEWGLTVVRNSRDNLNDDNDDDNDDAPMQPRQQRALPPPAETYLLTNESTIVALIDQQQQQGSEVEQQLQQQQQQHQQRSLGNSSNNEVDFLQVIFPRLVANTNQTNISHNHSPSTSSTSSQVPGASTNSRNIVASISSHHHNSQKFSCRENKQKTGESIISLLLKLHSQLSEIPDSFNIDEICNNTSKNSASTANNSELSDKFEESRIGDGPFFISKLLRKISNLDPSLKQNIIDTKNRLWPKTKECEVEQRERDNHEREERRKRAKERQQKLIAEFANRQKKFREKNMETEEAGGSGMDWDQSDTTTQTSSSKSTTTTATQLTNKKKYDCVICNQTTPSTEDKPMGLVVLVQSTSVVGHERQYTERLNLPTSDDEPTILRSDTRGAHFNYRMDEMNRDFDTSSWLLALNIGWEGGVHVQTCGHHIHLDCLKAYRNSLRTQQRQQSLAVDRGEYLCPLCRQLANSVLPMSPQLGECSSIVRSRHTSSATILSELNNFLKDIQHNPNTTNLSLAMGKAMEEMTASTYLKYKQKNCQPSHQSLFLFVTSVARTNFEVEIVQRGGTLSSIPLTTSPSTSTSTSLTMSNVSLTPKRDCIAALLHVLAMHARVLTNWPIHITWQQLCGTPPDDHPATFLALTPHEREVPLLLRDPTSLLIQFCLILPLHIDQTYFTTVVKVIYNLLYYQILLQVSCSLTKSERDTLGNDSNYYAQYPKNNDNQQRKTSELIMKNMIDNFNMSEFYNDEVTNRNIKSIEQQIQLLCLPFLRVAALLRHHLYSQPLPEIRTRQTEFVRLVYYLELITEGMDWDCFNAAVALNWQDDDTSINVPKLWCDQYLAFYKRSQIAGKRLVIDQHISWQAPKLLNLPREYEKLFTYYHEKQCCKCHSVPPEISICLLCGTIVCLKQNCCKQQNVGEAVQHSIDCGGGTGIYLVVTSTYIIVIRGRRACLWGSLYLDDFEEEDKDLKRGKPLYLSKERYQLLEQQWLAHRFDHTKKTWVWHRDAL